MFDKNNPDACFQVIEQDIGAKYPWGQKDEPVYNASTGNHDPLTTDVPVILKTRAKRISAWTMKNNSADDPPKSPVTSNAPQEVVELVPYGSCRLRVAVFPYADTTGWVTPADQVISAEELKAAVRHFISPQGITFMVDKEGNHAIDIFSMSGRVLKSYSGKQKARYVLPRNGIPPGLYVMRATVGSRKQTAKLLIH
jgi:hypothetical protein